MSFHRGQEGGRRSRAHPPAQQHHAAPVMVTSKHPGCRPPLLTLLPQHLPLRVLLGLLVQQGLQLLRHALDCRQLVGVAVGGRLLVAQRCLRAAAMPMDDGSMDECGSGRAFESKAVGAGA